MPELDRLKEELAYAKYWQGIMVVTDVSLIGWLISAGGTADAVIRLFAVIGVGVLTLGIYLLHRYLLHRQIARRIDQIGKL